MVIDGDTIRLRPLRLEDAPEWLLGEDDEIVRWFEFPRRSTRSDVERAIERWAESWRAGGPIRCWAICDVATGAIAGGVELRQVDLGDVNLSYWVFGPWRGRGIATRAAELALQYAAASMGASRAIIKILEGNQASLVVAQRLGAQVVARNHGETGRTFLILHRLLGDR